MTQIAVVGLGYVGLPLAVAFGRCHQTLGYDSDAAKVAACEKRRDPAEQLTAEDFAGACNLRFSADPSTLAGADFIIVAVPTPVDTAHQPDFSPLISASRVVGENMKKGVTVVFESTVYPGATEEICVPALERCSGMRWRRDFNVAYSPERINPGDAEHTLASIVKLVAGDDEQTLEATATLYESIVPAGVYRASSIQVAEAAKVIENTQRDLNIALVNELAIIFDRLELDTEEVLKAAGTKWNFLPFRPGLVGGHCIGVDPYYLTHKAQMVGYHPQVILAGRQINDAMGKFVAEQTVKQMIQGGSQIKGAQVNVLGLSFKDNCADLRNTLVISVIEELRTFGVRTHVCDPIVDKHEAAQEYGLELTDWEQLPAADAVVVAVAHDVFREMGASGLVEKVRTGGCVIDVKSAFDADQLRASGVAVWRL